MFETNGMALTFTCPQPRSNLAKIYEFVVGTLLFLLVCLQRKNTYTAHT